MSALPRMPCCSLIVTAKLYMNIFKQVYKHFALFIRYEIYTRVAVSEFRTLFITATQ